MIVGIDLGTTNSLIAYFDGENGAKIIPNRLGENLTPSVVSIGEDGTVYVGQTAKGRRITHPQHTVEVFKRDMGTKRVWKIGDREFTPTELSALVLKSLKEDAESYLGEEVTEAVISVPAYFNEQQRKATKIAGELAGLKVERLISEPTAAAIAYGLDECEEGNFLVFDLGGGTFDISLLEYEDEIMEVHCVAGDNFLGGENFSNVLYELFVEKHGLDKELLGDNTKNHIAKQAELCKLALSDDMCAKMQCKVNDELLEMSITREQYKNACEDLLDRLHKPIAKSLRDAKLHIEDIDRIVMVGGSTKMPIVRSFVSGLFKKFPDCNVNPDEVVAIGACMQAAMKERNKYVEDLILTDVCPYTMGVGVNNRNEGGLLYSPIIQRNSTVPVSRTQTYYTIHDYQKRITLNIYQGENRKVDNNLKIGTMEVSVPPNQAGEESIDVTFTYDMNSLLEVMVKVRSTGEISKKIIMNEDSALTLEEAQERFQELEYLKIPPREQEKNKLVLFRAEELYEELMGRARNEFEYYIEQFEDVLSTQEPELIDEARERLEEAIRVYRKS